MCLQEDLITIQEQNGKAKARGLARALVVA